MAYGAALAPPWRLGLLAAATGLTLLILLSLLGRHLRNLPNDEASKAQMLALAGTSATPPAHQVRSENRARLQPSVIRDLPDLLERHPTIGIRSMPTSIEISCAKLITRSGRIRRSTMTVHFFGDEGLYVNLAPDYVDRILWGPFDAAVSAADEQDAVAEVTFSKRQGFLVIDFETNGRINCDLASDTLEALEDAQKLLQSENGWLEPCEPPYGTKLRIRLPAQVIAAPHTRPALEHATTDHSKISH